MFLTTYQLSRSTMVMPLALVFAAGAFAQSVSVSPVQRDAQGVQLLTQAALLMGGVGTKVISDITLEGTVNSERENRSGTFIAKSRGNDFSVAIQYQNGLPIFE